MDELQYTNSLQRVSEEGCKSSSSTDETSSATMQLSVSGDRPPTAMREMLLGQALNLIPPCFKQQRMKYVMNILNEVEGCSFASLADLECKAIEIEHVHGNSLKLFGTPHSDLLWSTTFATKTPHMLFMGPPTTTCLRCSKVLKSHNPPSQVLCFSWNGPLPALKITLRCTECMINYRYKINTYFYEYIVC